MIFEQYRTFDFDFDSPLWQTRSAIVNCGRASVPSVWLDGIVANAVMGGQPGTHTHRMNAHLCSPAKSTAYGRRLPRCHNMRCQPGTSLGAGACRRRAAAANTRGCPPFPRYCWIAFSCPLRRFRALGEINPSGAVQVLRRSKRRRPRAARRIPRPSSRSSRRSTRPGASPCCRSTSPTRATNRTQTQAAYPPPAS